MKVLMLHGINLNMVGKRDPKQYGTQIVRGQIRGFGVGSSCYHSEPPC